MRKSIWSSVFILLSIFPLFANDFFYVRAIYLMKPFTGVVQYNPASLVRIDVSPGTENLEMNFEAKFITNHSVVHNPMVWDETTRTLSITWNCSRAETIRYHIEKLDRDGEFSMNPEMPLGTNIYDAGNYFYNSFFMLPFDPLDETKYGW